MYEVPLGSDHITNCVVMWSLESLKFGARRRARRTAFARWSSGKDGTPQRSMEAKRKLNFIKVSTIHQHEKADAKHRADSTVIKKLRYRDNVFRRS
jgi:hypothetical protein